MAIVACEKSVIDKVRGVAYGMGVNMALACDIVFASDMAHFCDSYVKVGLMPGDGGVLMWPATICIHRAKEYLITDRSVTAEVAEEIGLISCCMPEDELRRLSNSSPRICHTPSTTPRLQSTRRSGR